MNVDLLYRRYGPMVIRRCTQLLRDEEQALDAAQDVFVRLMERRDRINDDYPSSLLYRMATNLCLNRIRDSKRRKTTTDQNLLEQIADWDDSEGRIAAGSVLERLFGGERESTRTMAVLHYVDGMTLEQVANEVSMSVSGVRKRLRGLRASLQELEKS
ncbi:MAG: RNA polymerase sigma factor [Candidatus Latescibacterota bacterium]